MVPNSQNRHGRPNKAEQVEIENKITSYFSKFFNPIVVSQLTGYNIKTVRKYYNKFQDRIIANREKDYVKEWQIIKNSASSALELELAERHELQNRLKKQFNAFEENGKPAPSWMYKERRRLSESIQNMILSLANLALSPTADFIIKNQTRELIQEHGLNQ